MRRMKFRRSKRAIKWMGVQMTRRHIRDLWRVASTLLPKTCPMSRNASNAFEGLLQTCPPSLKSNLKYVKCSASNSKSSSTSQTATKYRKMIRTKSPASVLPALLPSKLTLVLIGIAKHLSKSSIRSGRLRKCLRARHAPAFVHRSLSKFRTISG